MSHARVIRRIQTAVVLGLWTVGCLPVLHALEFTAYLRVDSGYRFVISDGQPLKASEWLRLGQAFQDDQIVDFDPKTEVLTVKTPNGVVKVPLKDAHVIAQPIPPEPVELRLRITLEGKIEFGNVPIALTAIDEFFRTAAAKGTVVWLRFEQAPGMSQEQSKRAIKSITEIIHGARASGVKKIWFEIARSPEDAPSSKR